MLTTAALLGLMPQQKAALVVVSGLPAPAGVGGVIVQRWDRNAPRPAGTLVFVDQEGGDVRAFRELPPTKAARRTASKAEAYAVGQETGAALRRYGVRVDLAPVLDLPDGPLGARHYRSPFFGVAFARGLAAEGVAACAKHFPGLGTLRVSTDKQPYVRGHVRDADLAPYRAAVEADVPCISVVHGRAARWAVGAARAGADLLLFTDPADARRAIAALVPLARSGELDPRIARFLRFRSAID